MKRIVIVGGGVTGIATAHALERAATRCEVRLVESAAHLGGGVRTIRHNGFTLDAGADSWAAEGSRATRLAREVGLGDELIGPRPEADRRYVAYQRALHPVASELFLDLATPLRPLLEGELLGWDAKLRAMLERIVPRREPAARDDDESIASFVARRFGPEVVERLADPAFGAVFAGDVDSLSVHAAAPALVRAEREHGSVLAAAAAARRDRARATIGDGVAASHLSLERGIGDLVVNIAHKLRDAEVLTSCPARSLARLPEGDARGRWTVETRIGPLHADDVVLAVPAWVAGDLVEGLDAELARACRALVYASVANVFVAYRSFDVRHPLDAAGILVPRSEDRPVRECSFVSSRWDHRAPGGQVLLRVTLGGMGREGVLAQDDGALVETARAQVKDLLGVDRPPTLAKVFRFDRSVVQPTLGHVARVQRIVERARAHAGLHIASGTYAGGGVERAVRGGEALASAIRPLR
jgi:oxygen-dependent protoporphyrinogen oxidase